MADPVDAGARVAPSQPTTGEVRTSLRGPADRLRTDVASTLRGTIRARGVLMSIVATTSPRSGPARVAVVASRKVGSAVQRNRAKRLLREAIHRVDWVYGFDVVLIAHAECAARQLDSVQAELDRLVITCKLGSPSRAGVRAGQSERVAS